MRLSPLALLLLSLLLFSTCQTWDLSDPMLQAALAETVLTEDVRIKIRDKDYPYLIEMLNNPDPQIRLAAIKLAEYNMKRELFFPLLERVLDDTLLVSREAINLLLRIQDSFLPWISPQLKDLDYEWLLPTLGIIVEAEYQESLFYILELFEQESPAISRAASEALAGLLSPDDPRLLSMKDHEQIRYRAAYYQILSYMGDPELIPLILEGLNESETEVRGTAVISLYPFRRSAIPYLERAMETLDLNLAQAIIQFMEQNPIPEGIPLLIGLLDSDFRILSQRSAILMTNFKANVLPYLRDAFNEANPNNQKALFWILEKIKEPEAIPLYIDLLQSTDPALWASSRAGLNQWGEESWPALREAIDSAEGPARYRLLGLLRDQGDPGLLVETSGVLNHDLTMMLILGSNTSQIQSYLEKSGHLSLYGRETLLLKEASTLASELRKAETTTDQDEELQDDGLPSYHELYRQWENLLEEAEQMEQQAREENKKFFDTGNTDYLDRSRELKELGEALNDEARLVRNRLDLLKERSPEDEELIEGYIQSQDRLAEIWQSLSPSFRELGDKIYRYWGIDSSRILRLKRLRS